MLYRYKSIDHIQDFTQRNSDIFSTVDVISESEILNKFLLIVFPLKDKIMLMYSKYIGKNFAIDY